jgi:uncharacterized protein
MKSTIIITAANGFIGRHLVNHLKDKYRIIALVRKPAPSTPDVTYYVWDGRSVDNCQPEFEGALAVINLSGKSVNCRYNEKNKAEIYASRLESTHTIGMAIERCTIKPKVWLNAASATIYAHSECHPNTEENGIIGTGFSVDVCQIWERCFFAYDYLNIRQIALRTAIVLGREGGVMVPFKRLARLGLGGRMGNGKQQFSWIHEDDLCRAVEHFIIHEASEGIYNLSAPNPVTNAEFLRTLRKMMNIPFGLPQPKWLLKFGAWLIGTETELIFKSRFVLPERLQKEGFRFDYKTITGCLKNLIRE